MEVLGRHPARSLNKDGRMFLTKRLQAIRDVYAEYPGQFWILVSATFVDRLGTSLVFPFFTLYVSRRFGAGMTQVGLIFGLFHVAGLVGGTVGGALTDRIGRKSMLIFGLVASALSSLWMGLAPSFPIFVVAAVVAGTMAETGGPARPAMVADLLPPEKRAQGFGMLRVVSNLALTVGPIIGGLLATQSYLLLFVGDAVSSLVTAAIALIALRESRPVAPEGTIQPNLAQTFAGYIDVFRHRALVWFVGAAALMSIVYIQMYTTLSIYLRGSHGVTEQGYGILLSVNAALVVLFQIPIARRISRHNPALVMAAGTALYAVGFGLYGVVSGYVLFLGAIAIVTLGEMLVMPMGPVIVAQLAPAEMRGRYMATFNFGWVVAAAAGPFLAGVVMDNADPRWIWFLAFSGALAAASAFLQLERRLARPAGPPVAERRLVQAPD
jgi:MFS family permease